MLTSAFHHVIACWGHLSSPTGAHPALQLSLSLCPAHSSAQTRPDLNLAAEQVKSQMAISNNQKISTQFFKNQIISVYIQQNSMMLLKHLAYHPTRGPQASEISVEELSDLLYEIPPPYRICT